MAALTPVSRTEPSFYVPTVAAFGALSSIFITDEREKVLVLQFGQIKQVKTEPGLGFKIPFIQEVVRYDGRILSLDTPAIEITPRSLANRLPTICGAPNDSLAAVTSPNSPVSGEWVGWPKTSMPFSA
mgnify:CR=1 FL=1